MCLKNIKSHLELKVQIVLILKALIRQLLQEIHRFIQDQNQLLKKLYYNLLNTTTNRSTTNSSQNARKTYSQPSEQTRKVILLLREVLNLILPLQIQGIVGRILHQADHQEVNLIHLLPDRE